MNIELDTSPAERDLAVVHQGIKAYNQEHLPDAVVFEPDTRFAAFVRNDAGEVIGGIRANAYWNYCLIELLWLSKAARGKGLGSELVAVVEDHARSCGFEYIRTETVDFQARPFYEACGYTVFGELQDYPKGHTTYCLVKAL